MRAARLYGPGDIRIVGVEMPVPRTGEVLIRIKEVGICASDLHWYREGRIGDTVATEPLILGHEFAGVIEEVGPGVTDVKKNDRVAVEPAIPCYQCDLCADGDYNLCRNIRFCGTAPTDGAFQEFLVWPSQLVVPIPDSMSMGEAAMLEPLAVGVYAVELAESLQDKRVGILGAGAIGLSIMQAAIVSGCTSVFVTDPIPERLEMASRLGASKTFDSNAPDMVDSMNKATSGRGLEVVFEAAGENEAVCKATELVRPKGLAVIGGIPVEDSMTITASTVRRKGLTLKLLRRSNNTLHKALRLVEEGKVDVASYITHRFPLDQIRQALEVAEARKDGAIRVAIVQE